MDILSSLLRSSGQLNNSSEKPLVISKDPQKLQLSFKGEILNFNLKVYPELESLEVGQNPKAKLWMQTLQKYFALNANSKLNLLNTSSLGDFLFKNEKDLSKSILLNAKNFPESLSPALKEWSNELTAVLKEIKSLDFKKIKPQVFDKLLLNIFKSIEAIKEDPSFKQSPNLSKDTPALSNKQKLFLQQNIIAGLESIEKAIAKGILGLKESETQKPLLLKANSVENLSDTKVNVKINSLLGTIENKKIELLSLGKTQQFSPPLNPIQKEYFSQQLLSLELDDHNNNDDKSQKLNNLRELINAPQLPLKSLNSNLLKPLLHFLSGVNDSQNTAENQVALAKQNPLRINKTIVYTSTQTQQAPSLSPTFDLSYFKDSAAKFIENSDKAQTAPNAPIAPAEAKAEIKNHALLNKSEVSNFNPSDKNLSPKFFELAKSLGIEFKENTEVGSGSQKETLSLSTLTLRLLEGLLEQNERVESFSSKVSPPKIENIKAALDLKLHFNATPEQNSIDPLLKSLFVVDALSKENPLKEIFSSPLEQIQFVKATQIFKEQAADSLSLKTIVIPPEIDLKEKPISPSLNKENLASPNVNLNANLNIDPNVIAPKVQEELGSLHRASEVQAWAKSLESHDSPLTQKLKERLWVDQLENKNNPGETLYYQTQGNNQLQALKVSLQDNRKSKKGKGDALNFKIRTQAEAFGNVQIYGDLKEEASTAEPILNLKIYTEKSGVKTALSDQRPYLAQSLSDLKWILRDLTIFEPQLKLRDFKEQSKDSRDAKLDIKA